VQVKLWNNGDKLLKKSIGDGLDGEIDMGAETQSRHGGPRLSMEAQWRLEFAEGCRNDIFDESGAESSDRSGGQNFDYTVLKRTAAPRLRADIILPPFLMPNYIPYSTFVSISH